MFLSFLLILFVGLCLTLLVICSRVATRTRQFLERNKTIANEKSLDEYKSVVKTSMYLTLALIGIVCTALCISAVLIWLKGIPGALSLLLLGVALGFAKDVGKLEEQARSLPCADSDLERRYQDLSKSWVKQALPNF